MNIRMLVALGLACVLVPTLPAVQASHVGWYATNPIEHDDQGRSSEPDFLTTGVLGAPLENKVIDTNLDGTAVADSGLGVVNGVLAPGCTDDAGRQPSGLCGMWTVGVGTSNGAYNPGLVPPGTVGTSGMGGSAAPGAFTPNKGTAVRFLDALHHLQLQTVGSAYIEYNHKLQDLGINAALGGMDENLAGKHLIGPSAVWAWYGKWTDKNGNGVIDNYYSATLATQNDVPLRADEEFVWYGNCNAFPDLPNPASVTIGYCAYDEDKANGGTTQMLSFMYPGNHHAYNGAFDADPLVCAMCQLPADFPAHQVHNFLGAGFPLPRIIGVSQVPVCVESQPAGGLAGFVCGTTDLRNFDNNDEQFFGDPLLGTQHSVAPDGSFHDRTGEPAGTGRQWVHGVGWQTYFYDDGLLSTLITVAAVGCTPDGSANTVNLDSCRSADVDKYDTINPQAEALIQGTVKPTARSNWVTVRDTWIPFATTIDGQVNAKALFPSEVLGPVDDVTQNPGKSREPNSALDSYPAATRGTGADGDLQHNGFYNGYATHQAAAHGFGDLQAFRLAYVLRPVGESGACTLCVAGGGSVITYAGEAPGVAPVRAAKDHRQTLGPGQYLFGGVFGQWQDKAQTWEESLYVNGVLTTNTYTAAPDGWVGNVVNATGAFYYRGYSDEACSTDQGVGMKTYAACHPYLDGALIDPQQFGTGQPLHGEFVGRCDSINGGGITLTPAGGIWTAPTIVHTQTFSTVYVDQPEAEVAKFVDYTGTSTPIVLDTACTTGVNGGGIGVGDLLILPLGNYQMGMRSSISIGVGTETVTDVDEYVGWG